MFGVEHHGTHFEEAAVAFESGAGLQDGKDFVGTDHPETGKLSQQTTRMEAGQRNDEKVHAEEVYVEKA
jgi:hypothetical protein